MKNIFKITCTTVLIILFGTFSFAQTYYVAPSGVSALSTNINAPGDITFAFANAPKHSVVYVKSGNYGNVILTVGNDSTRFVGYHLTPGDLDSTDVPDSLNAFLTNQSVYENKYPVLDNNDRTSGIAINITGKNDVVVRNFFITQYLRGIYIIKGENCIIENILLTSLGNISPPDSYSGNGLVIWQGKYMMVKNCFLLNSAQEGFTMSGSYNKFLRCKAYANDNSTGIVSSMDYYFIIGVGSGQKMSRNNLIKDCYAERVGDLDHNGHGFCIVGGYTHKNMGSGCYAYDSTKRFDSVCYNVVENCTAKNIVGEVALLRGANTCYNEFRNVRSLKGGSLAPTTGARWNTFINCEIKDSWLGVAFVAQGFGDTTDVCAPSNRIGSYPWEQKICAEGNRFINCLFDKVEIGIKHDSYNDFWLPEDHSVFIDRINRKIVKDNEFINCTFIAKDSVTYLSTSVAALKKSTLFYAMRGNIGNKMINCIVYDFDRFESRWQEHSTSAGVVGIHGIIPTNYTYDHCDFYKNDFDVQIIANGSKPPLVSAPLVAASNNVVGGNFINCNTLDPGFENPLAGDYRIRNCMNCGTVDKGRTQSEMNNLGYSFLTTDLIGNTRPCKDTFDIGVYEFQNCKPEGISDSKNTNTFLIYPNPANNLLTVSHENLKEYFEVFIYTLHGQKIAYYQNQKEINIATLPAGAYFVKLKLDDRIYTQKLIKLNN